uniref:Neurotoxin BmK-M11 n=1 Tax=Olivierus martensii TaxID=34649 RepID=SCXB_OLIMR|nr:RecName: Full=Neurotoxin BmK-M11; Short=BmK11; Short=Bmk M11; Short=BmkM11; AltName: Full=Alpha-neurotoxin TX14; Short=BmalphaTX14; AltName: Full=BmK M4'; AltName: Full=BmK-XI; Flags: Precursor [Mesobuthus martensii]AAF29462.1 toxin alphaTX14 [Mesobuthus martensii]AAF34872.1 neurotoxin BmK4' precursor [Mesobuthus martensii]AAK06897.1 alpha-neurotoxin TX14 [Mesobuthus martensii]
MNYLVMISFALLLMTGVESVRDAYIAKPENCVYHCATNEGCNKLCTDNGAESGYCQWGGKYGNACWCIKLPDDVPIRVPGKCHR